MRALLAPALFFLSLSAAQADCLAILDYDKRQACLAEQRRDPSTCIGVRDYDRRQACLAEQRADPAGCMSVRDWDAREACRQRAGQSGPFRR